MLAALNKPLEFQAAVSQVSAWRDTLVHWLIQRLPFWLLEEQSRLDIHQTEDGYRVLHSVNDSPLSGLAVQHHEIDDLTPVVARLINGQRPVRIRYWLRSEDYLSRVVSLPVETRRNLLAAAELQVDVETPFLLRDVHVGALPCNSLVGPGPIDVEIMIAPKQHVTQQLEKLARAGIEVDDVVAESRVATGLHHTIVVKQRHRPPLWLVAALACLCSAIVVLSFSVVYAPLYLRERQADAIESEAAIKLSTATQLDADLARAIANVGFSQRAVLEKENQPSILELLRLVTEATTDDTYLDRFAYRNGQIEIAGVTSSTSMMIDQIGKAGLLTTPTYLAPVSRGQDGLEHFNLSFKLTDSGAP